MKAYVSYRTKAERHGITDAEEFLKYMSRALETYKRAAVGKP